MKAKTVRQRVLEVILLEYPVIKNHLLHNASEAHPFSTMQRLRELKKSGVDYTFSKADNTYNFSDTPFLLIQGLAEREAK